MDDELQEIKHRLRLYDALLLEPEGDGSLMGRFFAVAHSRGSDIQRLLARVEELEKVAADARTAVHYSRITTELVASVAALDALKQPSHDLRERRQSHHRTPGAVMADLDELVEDLLGIAEDGTRDLTPAQRQTVFASLWVGVQTLELEARRELGTPDAEHGVEHG